MVKVRRGFTLVELLIVIVIIGILAAAMLLSSGAATASAEAANIVSELRSMKAAALMFYADSMDDIATVSISVNYLKPYVDNPSKYDSGNYKLSLYSNKWWVGFDISHALKPKEVNEKLAGRAKTTGLLGDTDLAVPYTTTHTVVWMVAR